MTRADWDDTWMGVARVMSGRSACVRAKVGAVIVSATNRVIATGYNGYPAGDPIPPAATCLMSCPRAESLEPDGGYLDCNAIHAEANALLFCDRRQREGGTLYVTTDVCFTCAKLVANSGVRRVVVCHSANATPWRESDRSYDLMRACDMVVDEYRG